MPNRGFFAPFRSHLNLMALLLVVPAFGLVLYGNFEQRRIEQARVRDEAIARSQLAAANERYFIENARQLLAALSQIPFLMYATSAPLCEVHFANLQRLAPDYLNFGLIETNGMLFASGLAVRAPLDLSDRTYFRRVMETRRFSAGDFQVGRMSGRSSFNFGYPVLNERGEVMRVLFASLDLSRLSDAVANLQLPPGGTVVVFDRLGNVLARQPDPEKWVGRSLEGVPVVQQILAGTNNLFEMPGVDGVPRLHAVTPIPDGRAPGLFVSVGVPLDVSFGPSNQALVRNLIMMGLVAVVVLLGVKVYAGRFVLRPVNTLATTAAQLAEGKLDARAGMSDGAAELVELGRTFDNMAERLQKRQAEVAQAHEDIQRLNQSLERRVMERTAELELAVKELESFSYSVSHDLRAPLRHIGGFVNMLSENSREKLDERGRRCLTIINDTARGMGNLIDDLLGFSRMGRAEMRRTDVDLNALTHDAVTSLQSETVGRNIVWRIAELPQVEGDPAMLRQVLVNLIDNALKYSRLREAAEIEIGCHRESPHEFTFFVRDNGVGFDMQYVDKLFGVFQRLHHAEEFEGTGVGLANVRRIIQRHGGRTWAEGKLDGGATIYFTMRRPPEKETTG